MDNPKQAKEDALFEGRETRFMDIDRMTNEGLGGGQVTDQNGWVEETSIYSMARQQSFHKEE